jgi:hypothetical protein
LNMNALALALEKVNVTENVELTSDYLENGLTHTIIHDITIGEHCLKRIRERMGIKDTIEARRTIKDYLKKAKFIGLTPSSDGGESYLYSYMGVGIHVSTDYRNVKTVVNYNADYVHRMFKTLDHVKASIVETHEKEMRKLTRRRKSLLKKDVEKRLDFNVELAELERKIYRTKSEKSKETYIKRKQEILMELNSYTSEKEEIETQMRTLSGAMSFLYR